MKTKTIYIITLLLFPLACKAQSVGQRISTLQQVLNELYQELLPLCSELITVGRLIAGFAAIWYIGFRIWKHLAQAEPVDFFPLLRPFGIGLCILFFPAIIAMVNGVLYPTVSATKNLLKNTDQTIEVLLDQKQQLLQQTDQWKMYVGVDGFGDRSLWYDITLAQGEQDEQPFWEQLGNSLKFAFEGSTYRFKHSIKLWLSEVLKILYYAAALCIDTLRIFQLLVLAILGPLAFGISVFDGFHNTITSWFARYINVYLWLPVAHIFACIIGRIQQKMLEVDIQQIATYQDTFFSDTDAAYLIFLTIGIVGYFTVPSVANSIVQASARNTLTYKLNSLAHHTTQQLYTSAIALSALWGSHSSSNSEGSSYGHTVKESYQDSYLNDKIQNPN